MAFFQDKELGRQEKYHEILELFNKCMSERVSGRRRGGEEARRRGGEEARRRGGEEARRRGGEEARRRRRRKRGKAKTTTANNLIGARASNGL